MGSPEVQTSPKNVIHPKQRTSRLCSEIASSKTPVRDALLLTYVRWVNRNQKPEYQMNRGRAAVVAGTVLFMGVTAGPKVYETAMQVTGKRCIVEQFGYRVQPGDSIKGLLKKRHPGYNPIEHAVATNCYMEGNRNAGNRISDPTTLKIDGKIITFKVK